MALLTIQSQAGLKFGSTEFPLNELTEVSPTIRTGNVLSGTYVNVFKKNSNGTLSVENITKAEYNSLGLKNSGQPSKNGYTWKEARANEIFETVPNTLSDYQFAKSGVSIASTTEYQIKLPGYVMGTIDETDLQDGKISGAELNKLTPLTFIERLLPTVYAASPAVIGTNTATTDNASATSWTFSHTVPTATENNALIVWHGISGAQVSGITFNGDAMTKLGATFAAVQRHGSVVYHLAPPDVGTFNVVVSYAEARTEKAAVAFTLENVDTNPATVEDVRDQANAGAGATSINDDMTTATDADLVVVMVTTTGTSDYVPDTGQTSLGVVEVGGEDQAWSYEAKDPAGTINTGYAWTTGSNVDFYEIGLKYVAPAGGGATTPTTKYISFD